MELRCLKILLMLILCWGTPTSAISASVGSVVAHNPKVVHCRLRELVKAINEKDLTKNWFKNWLGLMIYTDRHGYVDYGERMDFLNYMRSANGKPDKKPLKLGKIVLLREDKDEINPLYVVELKRQKWEEEQMGDLTGLAPYEPAGYQYRNSYWLVRFRSNNVSEFREVYALYRFSIYNDELKGSFCR